MRNQKKTTSPTQISSGDESFQLSSIASKTGKPNPALICRAQHELFEAADNLRTGTEVAASIELMRKIALRISSSYPKETINAVFNRSSGGPGLAEMCALGALSAWRSSNSPARQALGKECLALGRELAALGANPNATSAYNTPHTPCSFCILDANERGGLALLDFFSDIGSDLDRCDRKHRNLLSMSREMNLSVLEHRLLELGARMPAPVAAFDLARLACAGDSWDDWKRKLVPVPAELAYYLVLEAPKRAGALWGLEAGAECLELIFSEHLTADNRAFYLNEMSTHFDLTGQTFDFSKLPDWQRPEVAFALGDYLSCKGWKSRPAEALIPELALAIFATRLGFSAEHLMAGFFHRAQLTGRPSLFNRGSNEPDLALAETKISEQEHQILTQAVPQGENISRARKRPL